MLPVCGDDRVIGCGDDRQSCMRVDFGYIGIHGLLGRPLGTPITGDPMVLLLSALARSIHVVSPWFLILSQTCLFGYAG